VEWYSRAIPRLEAVLKEQPSNELARGYLRNAVAPRARLLTDLNRPADALPDWDRALELAPESSRPRLRARRARTRAVLGDHGRATREAEEVSAKPPDWTFGHYDLACVFSLSVRAAQKDGTLDQPSREKASSRYAARALELLTEARQAGDFRTAARLDKLKTDPDLAPVRAHAEFQRFLAEQEQKKGGVGR
jgi:hypothetical protein